MNGLVLFAASDPNLPINVSALAALVGIVYWLVRRSDAADANREGDLATTRRDLATALAAVEIQRDEKHRLISSLAAAQGGLRIVKTTMGRCSCGAMDDVEKFVKDLLDASHREGRT